MHSSIVYQHSCAAMSVMLVMRVKLKQIFVSSQMKTRSCCQRKELPVLCRQCVVCVFVCAVCPFGKLSVLSINKNNESLRLHVCSVL